MEARQPRGQDRDLPRVDARERLGRDPTTRQVGIPLPFVRDRDHELERACVGDEGFVEGGGALRDQAERDLALQKQGIGGPATQCHDRVAIFDGELPGITRGGDGLRKVDDDGGGEARILFQLIQEIGLEQLQRAVGIARLDLREVCAADPVVGLQHRAKVLLCL